MGQDADSLWDTDANVLAYSERIWNFCKLEIRNTWVKTIIKTISCQCPFNVHGPNISCYFPTSSNTCRVGALQLVTMVTLHHNRSVPVSPNLRARLKETDDGLSRGDFRYKIILLRTCVLPVWKYILLFSSVYSRNLSWCSWPVTGGPLHNSSFQRMVALPTSWLLYCGNLTSIWSSSIS